MIAECKKCSAVCEGGTTKKYLFCLEWDVPLSCITKCGEWDDKKLKAWMEEAQTTLKPDKAKQ